MCNATRRGRTEALMQLRVKCINLDSVKSIIFTKLESSIFQRQAHMVYIGDTGGSVNLMTLKCSKLFPKSTLEEIPATKDNAVILKTYSNSNIEH